MFARVLRVSTSVVFILSEVITLQYLTFCRSNLSSAVEETKNVRRLVVVEFNSFLTLQHEVLYKY